MQSFRTALAVARRQRSLVGSVQCRAFATAANEVAVSDEPLFLRYATPVPQAYSFSNLLSSIPTSKVSAGPPKLQHLSVITHFEAFNMFGSAYVS